MPNHELIADGAKRAAIVAELEKCTCNNGYTHESGGNPMSGGYQCPKCALRRRAAYWIQQDGHALSEQAKRIEELERENVGVVLQLKRKTVALAYLHMQIEILSTDNDYTADKSFEDRVGEIFETVNSPLVLADVDDCSGYAESYCIVSIDEYSELQTANKKLTYNLIGAELDKQTLTAKLSACEETMTNLGTERDNLLQENANLQEKLAGQKALVNNVADEMDRIASSELSSNVFTIGAYQNAAKRLRELSMLKGGEDE